MPRSFQNSRWSQLTGGLALVAAYLSGTNASALAPQDPSLHEQYGPIAVSSVTRRIARAQQAPAASVHHRPVHRAYATLDIKELQALTAPLDQSQGDIVTPQAAPAGLHMPDLAIDWNAKSSAYMQHYTTTQVGRKHMLEWLERLRQYGPSLQKILRAHGVPEDLIFVAMVESGIHGGRRSRVGASGIWQFMPSSGASYGLHRTSWVDDRNHVIKSTHAAALYLSDLHARFGNWALALAAYNAGYGLVLKAMRRHNTNNFWALRNIESGLPASTGNYTPKVLALAVIGHNAAKLSLITKETPAWDLVEIPAPPRHRLKDLAKAAEIDPQTFEELNAHLVRGITPPPSERTTLVIPRAWRAKLNRAIGHQKAANTFKLHRLRSGERVQDVAELLGITPSALLALNANLPSNVFRTGDQLIVPEWVDLSQYPSLPERAIAVPPISPRPGHRTLMVRVHANTSAQELERVFHSRWSDIVKDNGLDASARFFDGQTLLIQVPLAQVPESKQALYLMVDDARVPVYLRGSERYIQAELATRGLIRRAHRVSGHETLKSIAARYGCSAGSLGRINRITPHAPLREGQEIIVYIPRSRSAGTMDAPPPARLPRPGSTLRP